MPQGPWDVGLSLLEKTVVKLKTSERCPCFGEQVEAEGKPAPSGETAKEQKLSREIMVDI